jgi:DNA-binding CsgD family transcriptional regulator
VKFHLRNVNLKIGASNRTEAAHQALHHGLIS